MGGKRKRRKQTPSALYGDMPLDGVLPWALENTLMDAVRACEQKAKANPESQGAAIAAAAASWIASDVVCIAWAQAVRNSSDDAVMNACARALELYDNSDAAQENRLRRLARAAGWEQHEDGRYELSAATGTIAVRETATQTLLSELGTSRSTLRHYEVVLDAAGDADRAGMDYIIPAAMVFEEQVRNTLFIAVRQIQMLGLDSWHRADPYEDESLAITNEAIIASRESAPIRLDGWLYLSDSKNLLAAVGADTQWDQQAGGATRGTDAAPSWETT